MSLYEGTYLAGCDVLGASNAADYATNPIGPLSPAQLEKLDRVLTPEEQAAVSAYQSGVAETQAAEEHAKPGAYPVSVEFKPAPAAQVKPKPAFVSVKTPTPTVAKSDVPWWYWALAIGGGLVLIGGTIYVARKVTA